MKTLALEKIKPHHYLIAMAIMCAVVSSSNYLVQFPINHWLTWGAITYPVSFLISDLINRRFGPQPARMVVYCGFATAVIVSLFLSSPRIAMASGGAFVVSQLSDIFIFHRLRHRAWWIAPFITGIIAAIVDTFVFFGLAFVGTGNPWVTWSLGDLGVKLVVSLFMLAPFRALMWNIGRVHNA